MKKILMLAAALVLAGCGEKKGDDCRPPIPPRWPRRDGRHRHGRDVARQHVVRLHDGPGHRRRSKRSVALSHRAPGIARGPLSLRHPSTSSAPNGSATTVARRPPAITVSPGLTSRRSTPRPSTRSSSVSVDAHAADVLLARAPTDAAIERLRRRPSAGRAARGWCARGSAAGPPSPARCSSPWCTRRRRSRRTALPAAGSARRSRRRARASRRGSGRRAGRPRRRHGARGRSAGRTSGSTAGARPTGQGDERRRLRRQGHGHRAQLPADRRHPAGRLRHADARLGQHLESVRAEQPGDRSPRPVRSVAAREPGRQLAA